MQHSHDDPHDFGLQHDLNMIFRRRRVLQWMTSAAGAALAGACSETANLTEAVATSGGGSTITTTTTSSTDTCVADPAETAGPYPADGSNTANGSLANVLAESGVVRTDMRSSFGSSSTTAPGVRLDLTLTLVDVNSGCTTPLAGYAIYLWQANAIGQYSIYDLPNENYLRAVGVTDENGQVTFTTIFPGCYPGRYPHMHFEVYPSLALATSYQNRILVSQLAMPENECTAVYNNDANYAASISSFAGVTIFSDNVFGDNSTAEIEMQTPSLTGDPNSGYTGEVNIGIVV